MQSKLLLAILCGIGAAVAMTWSGCAPRSHAKITVENQAESAVDEISDMTPDVSAPSISSGQAVENADEVIPLGVGDQVPDVRLVTSEGAAVDLPDLVKSQRTVLIFYRGGWCPYCNTQLSELQAAEQELQSLGYRVVAISPDRPAKIRETTDKLDLSYMLLSDSKAEAVRAFGLAFTVDDTTITRYLGYGINLDDASGEPHHQLPVPAVFIADSKGTIQYRYYNPDYKVRLSKDELLARARELK